MTTTATSYRPDRAMRASAVAPTAAVVTLGVVTVVVMALLGLSQVAGIGSLTGRLPGLVIGVPRLSITLPPAPHALPKPALPPRATAERATAERATAPRPAGPAEPATAPGPTTATATVPGAAAVPASPPEAVVTTPAQQEAHTPRRPPGRHHGRPVPAAPAPAPQPVQPAIVPATLTQAATAATATAVDLVRGLLPTTSLAPARRSFASVRTSATRSAAPVSLVAAARPVEAPWTTRHPAASRPAALRPAALKPSRVRSASRVGSAVHEHSAPRVSTAWSPLHHRAVAAPPVRHRPVAAPRQTWAGRGWHGAGGLPKALAPAVARGAGPATAAARLQSSLAHWPWHGSALG